MKKYKRITKYMIKVTANSGERYSLPPAFDTRKEAMEYIKRELLAPSYIGLGEYKRKSGFQKRHSMTGVGFNNPRVVKVKLLDLPGRKWN